MSFLSRMGVEMGNAILDAYGNLVYGDDAGKSAKLVFVARPRPMQPSTPPDDRSTDHSTTSYDLGMTFLEVNNRAYVKTVTPDSEAALAGVQPRDAVQFAFVHTDVKISPTHTAKDQDEKAAHHALECERNGQRTSFRELRGMFPFDITSAAHGTPNSAKSPPGEEDDNSIAAASHSMRATNTQDAHSTNHTHASNGGHHEDSDSQLSDMKRLVQQQTHHPHTLQRDHHGEPLVYPVTIVFRRTRQRKRLVGGGMPHLFIPNFRLDDECDRAALLVSKLAPTADMPPQPDAWDEIVHDGTEWLFPDGSILPGLGGKAGPTNGDTGGAASSSNSQTSTHQPTNTIKRVDSGEFDNVKTGEDTIPQDQWEARSTAKIKMVKQRMHEEAKLRAATHGNEAEDVEAATIRGMIQKAVGLAFVRNSKVVLGVSIHCGSGIVIARLPDGTWSAPSAVGTWGLGLGLQFGLEVADYIFILQTEDSLAHFKSGGNFTIGGNVGAAVAGLGREAYGAASVKGSLCAPSEAVLQDDETVAMSIVSGGDGSTSMVVGSGPSKAAANSAAEVAPIVAYAKSQGLYFGVSLEGSRIFTRNDLNARAYKFTTGKSVTANDILSGRVSTPPEAEDLYASLHSVEFAHELSCLPRPPEILRGDSPNDWRFDRSTLNGAAAEKRDASRTGGSNHGPNPFSFFSTITDQDTEECSDFETKFKQFLYGGVSVQRLVPNAEPTGGKTRRERRTLWLMLPEVGSLRLGFISKQHDGGDSGQNKKSQPKASQNHSSNGTVSGRSIASRSRRGDRDAYSLATNDDYTDGTGSIYSMTTEDVTVMSDYISMDETATQVTMDASTVATNTPEQRQPNRARNFKPGKVHLSGKYSMALSDVTCLSQDPKVSIRFSPDDATEHLRVVSIQDVKGTCLLFLANNFREAELLMCGLKLLLERETARLGVRGGISIARLGGNNSTPPTAALSETARFPPEKVRPEYPPDDGDDSLFSHEDAEVQHQHHPREDSFTVEKVPEGRESWSRVPGRDFLREQAAICQTNEVPSHNNFSRSVPMTSYTPPPASHVNEIPTYKYGEQIIREVATKVPLKLPLPLCRALLLDSSSPVITQWEAGRGDSNYKKSRWAFPPETPREHERFATEHQLIASGTMTGGYRTASYDRVRNGQVVNLTETQIVDADDDEKLAFTITERTPRRGFSLQVRILLRSTSRRACEATILGEVRPMGKNMSNQTAVHKAFCLVINEISMRYGVNGKGLLAAFLAAIEEHPVPPSPGRSTASSASSASSRGPRRNRSQPYNQNQMRGLPVNHAQQSRPYHPGQQQMNNTTPVVDRRQPLPTHNAMYSNVQERNAAPHSNDQRQPLSTRQQVPPPPPPRQAAINSHHQVPVHRSSSTGSTGSSQGFENSISFEDAAASRRATTNVVSPREESKPTTARRKTQPKPFGGDTAPMRADPQQGDQQPVTIEVKPLPKIRLDLMPAPREEDEDNESSSNGSPHHRQKSRRKSGSEKKKRSSRKSGKERSKQTSTKMR